MISQKQRTIRTYDTIAPDYSNVNFEYFWIDELKKFKRLIQGKKVLDIGCGAGRDAAMLIENGFDYTGIDASKGMLKVASRRVPRGKLMKMDFYKLKFPDAIFDGFWASASFLHVPKADVEKVILEAKRVIRPGGIGFISMKQKTTLDEGIIKDGRYGTPAARYFSFYEKNEFKKKLLDSGLKVISMTTHKEKGDRELVWLCYFVQKLT